MSASRTTSSPIGPLLLSAGPRGLREIRFLDETPDARPGSEVDPETAATLDRAEAQLREYFEGARRAFDLPLDPEGTEFQRRVWRRLETVPYGSTVSYGALAEALESPGAARAVGLANGSNPLPIVVPCHRVIGADGGLTGYGGGLERKRWLLRHEGVGSFENGRLF